MAIYDVCPNAQGRGYLLAVQSDLLDELTTRLVIPLLPEIRTPRPFPRLNPVFQVEGVPHVLATNLLAAVPMRLLRNPVANLEEHSTRITDAVDFLMHGY